jgi:hypothetical protein
MFVKVYRVGWRGMQTNPTYHLALTASEMFSFTASPAGISVNNTSWELRAKCLTCPKTEPSPSMDTKREMSIRTTLLGSASGRGIMSSGMHPAQVHTANPAREGFKQTTGVMNDAAAGQLNNIALRVTVSLGVDVNARCEYGK